MTQSIHVGSISEALDAALRSSRSLHQAFESFHSRKRAIRELKREVEALRHVLEYLQHAATDSVQRLELPLLRCAKAYEGFENVIVKCTAHSDELCTSFEDCTNCKYMRYDIAGFTNVLTAYRFTIDLVLTEGNLYVFTALSFTDEVDNVLHSCEFAVMINVLKEYKTMLNNTTSDLKEQLQVTHNRL